MAEAIAAGKDTPGPQYKITETNVFKKRTKSFKFDSGATARLAPIKRSESQDFFDTNEAAKKHT